MIEIVDQVITLVWAACLALCFRELFALRAVVRLLELELRGKELPTEVEPVEPAQKPSEGLGI